MITFKVIKEQHGWAIRTATGITTPFRLKEAAIQEAAFLAESIRCHGQCVEVIIDCEPSNDVHDTQHDVHSHAVAC
jgi:hypothetical protein